MIDIRSKLPETPPSIFSVMSGLANKHNALNLSQGFPNFKSDSKLITLVTEAMHEGYNQYAPMQGSIELRDAIANKFKLLYKTSYKPDSEITVTAGATQAIFTVISTFIKKNDEVIIFKPAYDCYEPAITINGGKTVSVQLEAPSYKVNWEEVKKNINNNTKMIIVNTPQNPSGTLFSKSDMLTLQEIVKDTNIIILSDEVYEHIIFDNETHQSVCLFPILKEHSFIVASFGKTFHNTGWKLGYCCAPKDLMKEFQKVHQFNVFCVNHPMQRAIAKYINDPNTYLNLNNFYQSKRDYFLRLIKNSRFKITPTKGSYFQLLDFNEITQENDVNYAKRLTINHKIASIPMSVFNKNRTDYKVLRFCFAKTDETLEKAAEIINKL
jgi:methionine aminotransferase